MTAMKRLLALAAVLAALSPAAALAVDADDFVADSTEDLYQLCTALDNDPYAFDAKLFCLGYFSGAIDYHNSVVGPNIPPIVCAPGGTTRNEVIAVFTAWVKAREADRVVLDQPAIVSALSAAVDAWPCPAGQ